MYGGEVSDERDVRRAAFVGPLRTAPMATSPHQRGGSGIGIRAFDDLIAAPSDRPSTRPPGGEMQVSQLLWMQGRVRQHCCSGISERPPVSQFKAHAGFLRAHSPLRMQMMCGQCGCLLAYPAGSSFVRCGSCGVINQAPDAPTSSSPPQQIEASPPARARIAL